MNPSSEYFRVLELWFGELDHVGCSPDSHAARWWRKSDEFDKLLRTELGALHEQVAGGAKTEWLAEPWGRLALIIVADQLSRNLHRDTARMYALDPLALRACEEGRTIGHDQELPVDCQAFFYMPLMHSESLTDQQRSVTLYEELGQGRVDLPAKRAAGNLKAARAHLKIIERFGRFPHRNEILERQSTDDELAFLQQPGSSF